ncbi:MAG: DNA mismatch repair endonuclease MutH [Legionellales bacterium]|nr:DNA mismatch repair endonuclease MutH [Legionellales bacterium]
MNTPQNEEALVARAHDLMGFSLGELAANYNITAPDLLLNGKGWSGVFMELLLGATAGSLAEPDFQHLGIELKTIPINQQGKPLESTYISIVPLNRFIGLKWKESEVYHKLKRILWVPLLAGKTISPAERRIGRALLWSPTNEQEMQLQQDWQELMDRVALGELDAISASMGKYLQMRPKGANAASRCWGIDREGNRVRVSPRGFYLRPSFTQGILALH